MQEQLREALEALRDAGHINADTDEELEYLVAFIDNYLPYNKE